MQVRSSARPVGVSPLPRIADLPPLQKHVVQSARTSYYAYRPERWSGRVLVSVHGISRNRREHAASFLPLCAEAGVAMVAPLFSRRRYQGYQRLAGEACAADEALVRILDHATQLFAAGEAQRPWRSLGLFGFSGGAQFAHRFAMARPGITSRLALAAAGFYSFPDAKVRYPYGLDCREERFELCESGLEIPTRVFVGDLDVDRDPDLRTGAQIDRQQGRHRVDRARRWVVAVRAQQAARGVVPSCSLELVPGCGHRFDECVRMGLPERVFAHLFGGERLASAIATSSGGSSL